MPTRFGDPGDDVFIPQEWGICYTVLHLVVGTQYHRKWAAPVIILVFGSQNHHLSSQPATAQECLARCQIIEVREPERTGPSRSRRSAIPAHCPASTSPGYCPHSCSHSPNRRHRGSPRYRESPMRRYSRDGSYSPHLVHTGSRPS
jgi:hypothetical protein